MQLIAAPARAENPFGGCDPVCDDGLVPVDTPAPDGTDSRTLCVPDDSTGGPACPGLIGEPCCIFIADAGPCTGGAICDSVETGKPEAESSCIPCGGLDELACFESALWALCL